MPMYKLNHVFFAVALAACSALGCAEGSDGSTVSTGGDGVGGGAGETDLPAGAGGTAGVGGAAGSVDPSDIAGTGGSAGTAGETVAGSSGVPVAGTGGIPVAGSGGTGIVDSGGIGGGGAGGTLENNNFIRGPAPTAQSASQAGPYDVQSTTQGLRDPAEYGTQTLWYPTDAEPPFAAIAIVPGFVSPEGSIANWGPFLASHGIVVLTIGTNTGGDLPEVRSAALLAALDTIKAEHTRQGSPIEGKIDTGKLAVGGWSMGGGGTLLTITAHPELKAGLGICPWYMNAFAFAGNTVPVIMFAGTMDVLAGGMSQGFYDAIPASTPKMLFEIAGADHFYANDPLNVANPFTVQVGLYGLSWLKVFLEGDDRYRQFLLNPPQNASDFRTTVK